MFLKPVQYHYFLPSLYKCITVVLLYQTPPPTIPAEKLFGIPVSLRLFKSYVAETPAPISTVVLEDNPLVDASVETLQSNPFASFIN